MILYCKTALLSPDHWTEQNTISWCGSGVPSSVPILTLGCNIVFYSLFSKGTIQKIGKGLLLKEILCNNPDIFWDKPFLSVITLSNFDLESLSLKLMWIMYNITHCHCPKCSQKAWSVYYKLVEKILNLLQCKRLAKWAHLTSSVADKRSCSLFLHFAAEIQQLPLVWTLGCFIWQKVF